MKEPAAQGDAEGLQRQLDQCSVSPGAPGRPPQGTACSCPASFAAIMNIVRIGLDCKQR